MSKKKSEPDQPSPAANQVLVFRECRLKGDCLYWYGPGVPQDVSPNMLNEFVAISDSDSVCEFGQKWGRLGIKFAERKYNDGALVKTCESVDAWKYYSSRARAVLHVVAALKSGKLGDISDWDHFVGWLYADDPKKIGRPESDMMVGKVMRYGLPYSWRHGDVEPEEFVNEAHEQIAIEISSWLDCWKLEREVHISDFSLAWNDDQRRWVLQIDYHGSLFPAIAYQIAIAVADADGPYSCSGCGLPYVRSRDQRRPKSGFSNYCETCFARGVAGRRAVESYRERQREARELHDHGTSIEEIAKRLNTTGKRVRGWIQKGRNDGQKARQ